MLNHKHNRDDVIYWHFNSHRMLLHRKSEYYVKPLTSDWREEELQKSKILRLVTSSGINLVPSPFLFFDHLWPLVSKFEIRVEDVKTRHPRVTVKTSVRWQGSFTGSDCYETDDLSDVPCTAPSLQQNVPSLFYYERWRLNLSKEG